MLSLIPEGHVGRPAFSGKMTKDIVKKVLTPQEIKLFGPSIIGKDEKSFGLIFLYSGVAFTPPAYGAILRGDGGLFGVRFNVNCRSCVNGHNLGWGARCVYRP